MTVVKSPTRPKRRRCPSAGSSSPHAPHRHVPNSRNRRPARISPERLLGLYLNPPEWAAVFSFDEKTQCQALDAAQPSLPMKRGRGATMTHDYKRNGTIDLFAAMNIATGQVHTHLRKGHTGTDVLAFFKQIDKTVPKDLAVHVILDNLSAHKTPAIKEWLAHPSRARWHLHFTPTSSSWVNLIERWFKELTDKLLRRGTFDSVAALTEAITVWAEHWNSDPKPFLWKATAEDIITKVSAAEKTLHRVKSPTDHLDAVLAVLQRTERRV
ncbi:MAG: IS630 family transposase [Dermatophilaceae bacterium]